MTEEESTRRQEIERQRKVVDQMVTAYSVLRDHYVRRAVALTLSIFSSSVVLCTVTFVPDDALKSIGISAVAQRALIGIFSSLILFVSIAELCLRWREQSERYAEASDKLARLKGQLRDALAQNDTLPDLQCADLTRACSAAMEGLPRITDSQFVRLKAYHLRKVRLSQMSERAIGCPVWLLRFRLFLQGIRDGWKKSHNNESRDNQTTR